MGAPKWPPYPQSSERPGQAVALLDSLRQPHRVELLVQEVAGRDRPAPHLGAVRDDPVVLQRVEVVDLLVEQPLLERAQVPLALLGVVSMSRSGSTMKLHWKSMATSKSPRLSIG